MQVNGWWPAVLVMPGDDTIALMRDPSLVLVAMILHEKRY
jgi:hypothetical protein